MTVSERKLKQIEDEVRQRMQSYYDTVCKGNVNQRLNLQEWVISELASLQAEVETLRHMLHAR